MIRFLKYLSPDQMDFEVFKSQSTLLSIIIIFESFIVQLFLRQPMERPDDPYNDFEIIEIYGLVAMMKFGVPNLDEKSPISYSEAKEFLHDLTNIIAEGSVLEQFQNTIIKAFLLPLFTRDTIPMEFLDWDIFLGYINNQLKYAQSFLRWIFCYKMLVQESCFILPRVERNSVFPEINNSTTISFLMMSNIYMNLTTIIKMVFSSGADGLNFDKFVKKITEYDGPTLILIKNAKGNVYGGFKSERWERGQDAQGNPECYIFSLWPKFRNYFMKSIEKYDPKNAAYLNDAKHVGQRGLGK